MGTTEQLSRAQYNSIPGHRYYISDNSGVFAYSDAGGLMWRVNYGAFSIRNIYDCALINSNEMVSFSERIKKICVC